MEQQRRYQEKRYYEKQKRPLSEKKRKKLELIRELYEGFLKVQEARSADEFYRWQGKVEIVAFKLKNLEFGDFK